MGTIGINELNKMKTSAEKIIKDYSQGKRLFEGLEIEGDFKNQNLNGIIFDNCFIVGDFKYSKLENSVFSNGNIKTCDFRYSDLTNSRFNNLAVESTQFDWSKTAGIDFNNNYCYGQKVDQSDFEKNFKTNQSKPRFNVKQIFKLTNRGLVISGEIVEGLIKIGDELNIQSKDYEIIAVEMVDNIGENIAYIGLVIPVFDNEEIEKITDTNLNNTIIEITKKS